MVATVFEDLVPETREAVEALYSVQNGCITENGKFEGEPWWAVIVYGWRLDGDEGELLKDTSDTSVYEISKRERIQFGLPEDVYFVSLCETEQGFVFVSSLTQKDYDEYTEN